MFHSHAWLFLLFTEQESKQTVLVIAVMIADCTALLYAAGQHVKDRPSDIPHSNAGFSLLPSEQEPRQRRLPLWPKVWPVCTFWGTSGTRYSAAWPATHAALCSLLLCSFTVVNFAVMHERSLGNCLRASTSSFLNDTMMVCAVVILLHDHLVLQLCTLMRL